MLRWVFSADTGPFRKGLSQMRTEGKAWSGAMTRMFAGVFSAGAVLAGFRNWLTSMDALSKMARKLGADFGDLQRAKVVAEDNNISVQQLTALLVRLKRRFGEAASGSSAYADKLDRLGLSQEKLLNAQPTEILVSLAGAWQKASGSVSQYSDFMGVLDTEFRELIPTLIDIGEKGSSAFADIAVVSEKTGKRVEALLSSLNRTKQTVNVGFAGVFEGVRLVVETVGAAIGNWISILGRFFRLWSTGWREAGNILKAVLSRDFDGVAEAAGRMGTAVRDTMTGIVETTKIATGDVLANWKATFGDIEEEAAKTGAALPNILGSPEAIADRRKARAEEAAALAAEAAQRRGASRRGLTYDQRRAIATASTSEARFADELASIGTDRRPELDDFLSADPDYREPGAPGSIPVSSIRSIGGDIGGGRGLGLDPALRLGELQLTTLREIRDRLAGSQPPTKAYTQPRG